MLLFLKIIENLSITYLSLQKAQVFRNLILFVIILGVTPGVHREYC